jgi:hypothetical protein
MPYNPECPACREKRCHTAEEWRMHSGHERDIDRRYIRPEAEIESPNPQPEDER